MENAFFVHLIEILNGFSPVWILGFEIVFVYSTVMAMFHFFGKDGLFVYVTVAIIVANIQVLKVVAFPFLSDPIPLGTVMFVSTYLAVQIVNEHYGRETALKMVKLNLVGYFLFVVLMTVALAFRPIEEAIAANSVKNAEDFINLYFIQQHLMAIFAPAPSILVASLVAFAISQFVNVHIFSKLKFLTPKKLLWLRSVISSSIGSLLDNFIFSLIAFIILASEPLPWSVVLYSYVFLVFMVRFPLALLETPTLYLALKLAPKE